MRPSFAQAWGIQVRLILDLSTCTGRIALAYGALALVPAAPDIEVYAQRRVHPGNGLADPNGVNLSVPDHKAIVPMLFTTR